MEHLVRRHRPQPLSLLFLKTGSKLLERDALLSHMVLETHYSLDRGRPVAIVGIVVVQRTTVARVANPHIVGIASVRSAEPQNKPTSTRVTNSLLPIGIFFLCSPDDSI